MSVNVNIKRRAIRFQSDPKRVITRFFLHGDHDRECVMLQKVLSFTEEEVELVFNQVLGNFSRRHRNITKIFEKHFDKIKYLFKKLGVDPNSLSPKRKLLVGSYFTMEYAIEAAAFFNPSIVEDPDQSNLEENGQKRVIISFRATGEGHISSIVFRRGIIDKDSNIKLMPTGGLVDVPEIVKRHVYDKKLFMKKLEEMNIKKDIVDKVMARLGDTFIYGQLQASIHECSQDTKLSYSKKNVLQAIHWLASSHYEIKFSLDTEISQRVIFPISYTEKNGIEDARFVRFTADDGSVTYYATYTAYNGFAILPKLMETKDFYEFKVSPVNGEYSQDKGMALFPRKIKGKYVMVSRYDGVNIYIMYSDDVKLWRNAVKIAEPTYPWELVQMGNCGSPLETEKGWLLLTHGVGPVRRYCLGVTLLDLEDPTKVIANLKEALMVPTEEEREGYVPNVLYSCGYMIHHNELIIPYAMSDTCSSYATVSLDELFGALQKSSSPTQNPHPPQKPQKPGANAKTRGSILVVDDEPIFQKFIAKWLQDEGYKVEIAADGAEALMSIGAIPFDAILLDLNMPNLNGLQLMDILDKKKIHTPIIIISAEESSKIKNKTLRLGAVGYIIKSLKDDALLKELKKLLEKIDKKEPGNRNAIK
jgi:predicted GH43/DUF377 family glycosyl hydrolase/ActR/RegA family two-component response regulator